MAVNFPPKRQPQNATPDQECPMHRFPGSQQDPQLHTFLQHRGPRALSALVPSLGDRETPQGVTPTRCQLPVKPQGVPTHSFQAISATHSPLNSDESEACTGLLGTETQRTCFKPIRLRLYSIMRSQGSGCHLGSAVPQSY